MVIGGRDGETTDPGPPQTVGNRVGTLVEDVLGKQVDSDLD